MKNYRYFSVIFLSLLWMFLSLTPFDNSYGSIWLTVGITHNKGINKGLVLVSELQAIEEVGGNDKVFLRMKNELEVELRAKFVDDSLVYGPSDIIEIRGNIFNQFGVLLKSFMQKPIYVKLGKEINITYKDEQSGQQIELTITPNFY